MNSTAIQQNVFDETLLQIGDLLDAPGMRWVFERELGCPVEACQIVRAKLRPGRNCLVGYRLKVMEPIKGETREQLLTLAAFGKGESRERFNLAQRQPLVSTSIGKAVFHLPELEAVVWGFPNDRKLPGLPAITDNARLKELLPEIIANHFGREWEITALASDVVSYAAERACTVRVKLELSNSRTGASFPQTLFGKTYRSGEGEAVWRTMGRIWRQGRLLIPQPLRFQPEIHTLWQQGLAGNTLEAFDAESVDGSMEGDCQAGSRTEGPRSSTGDRGPSVRDPAGKLAKAGAAVAELHRLRIPDLPLREAVRPLEALGTAENLLVCAVPNCQPKLHLLVRRLTDAFGKIQTQPAAILHGDLHLKNFLATGEKIALIDWDNVCRGDPMQELGSFAASLHYRALLGERSVEATESLIDSFVEAYLAAPEGEVQASALNWHAAAALIYERAHRHVVRLNTDAPRVVSELIELALRLTGKL